MEQRQLINIHVRNLKKNIKKNVWRNIGVEHPVLNEEVKTRVLDKTKNTLLIKYGDENYNNREKFKKTCLEKYRSR